MPTSNIDDILTGAKSPQHPETPEHKYQEGPEEVQELEADAPEPDAETLENHSDIEDESPELETKSLAETDDYGNETVPENEVIRERLARQARKYESEIDALRAQLSQQGASPQVQQAAKDFEYNPNEGGDWQQQLAGFIKQTVSSMTREQSDYQNRLEESKVQAEFERKLVSGMSKFDDFRDVMSNLPFEITNPMTLATRAMDDPAAFLYAAAKRNPGELERISKIRDPYAQMTEIGKLEERMRRNKVTTKAPKPLGRTLDDASIPQAKKNKDTSIEDLIAKSEAKRLQRMRGRAIGRR